VFRSLKHIYAQAIDDATGQTVATASTMDKQLRKRSRARTLAAAKAVGELIADRLKEKGVTSVVFDRGGYLYHGNIKALADAAREKGLSF
jgi:large subunit ribosomal protein L18